jgi:hypothetical protein
MKARIGVASTGHAETRDLHELYAMSERSEGPAEKNSTTIAASIGEGADVTNGGRSRRSGRGSRVKNAVVDVESG